MDDGGQLVYRRRTGRGIWLFLLGPPIAAMAAALEDRNWAGGALASVLSVLLLAATLWIAIGWSGRTRLAEVRLDGDTLVVRRSHILDRGKTWRIPLSETRNWQARLEHYARQSFEAAAFDHRGVTYILPISGAQYADLDQLNAWIEQHAGDGKASSG